MNIAEQDVHIAKISAIHGWLEKASVPEIIVASNYLKLIVANFDEYELEQLLKPPITILTQEQLTSLQHLDETFSALPESF